jgi:RecB family exonuclease
MIQADLRRYLEHEARTGCDWRPLALEQRFGFEASEEPSIPPLELGIAQDGLPVRVRGAIDRIDVAPDGRRAIVRDYKTGSVRQESAGPRWARERKLQVPLYMLAVRELLGLEPVAGLYQPLRGGELRPRGAYLREVMAGNSLFSGDGCEPEELAGLLEDARARALTLAARLRAGELEPCPSTCSRDGCRHPGICRVS